MARFGGAIDPDAGIGLKGGMLTPEQLAGSGTEHAHQVAIIQWCVINGPRFHDLDLLFAIPNGGDRRPSVAASLKAEGVRSGVPDLCLPVPVGVYAGLYLELKKPTEVRKQRGGRSEKQVEWHRRLRAQHYAVVVAYGWQPAVQAIGDYYGSLLRMPEGTDDAVFYLPVAG